MRYSVSMKRNAAAQSPETLQLLSRLGVAIRRARLRRRLTQLQLAERAGLSKQTMGRLEGGDPGIALGSFLEVLAVLERAWVGEFVEHLEADNPGRVLENSRLPQRVAGDGF